MSNSEKLYSDSEEYKKVKNEINKEGFEDSGGESQPWAIIIGSKEERDRIKELLKQDQPAVNLATYIRLHKKNIGTKKEIAQLKNVDFRFAEFEKCSPGTATINYNNEKKIYIFLFKDCEGNLAKVELTCEDYAKFNNLHDLNNLGFKRYYYKWDEQLEGKLEQMRRQKLEQEIQANFGF